MTEIRIKKKDDLKKLQSHFEGKCDRSTISRALRYQNNSELAISIRFFALMLPSAKVIKL